jgi:S1-C subfamily serine protease
MGKQRANTTVAMEKEMKADRIKVISVNQYIVTISMALIISGCAAQKLNLNYDADPTFLLKTKEPVSLYLSPIEDQRPNRGQALVDEPIVINQYQANVPEAFHAALKAELSALGIGIANSANGADGILNGRLKKYYGMFDPCGSYCTSTVETVLRLELYSSQTSKLLWTGTLKSTNRSRGGSIGSQYVGETLEQSFKDTIASLRREPELLEAVVSLSGSPPYKKSEHQANVEKEQTPQSGTGSGFFISKMGHVITNAHVINGCNRVSVGDNANTQVPAKVISADRRNDLALLKITSLEMASAESKSLIQKLSIGVIPLSSKGLLRVEDVRLGEKVLVAGYPYGDVFSNTIKVTSGIVSATRGSGDDSGQFQLDAAVQPGNSGGPIYDSSGNIVGVVISQLDKLKIAKAIGSLPENVNFGIKASTVRQFLISSGLPSKKSERLEEKSTEELAEIATNQALMVMCLP